jgi:hypothetical protein
MFLAPKPFPYPMKATIPISNILTVSILFTIPQGAIDYH